MNRAKALLLGALLLALPLAGCLGGGDEDQAPLVVETTPPPTAEAYTGVSIADADTHIHDYWNNRTEVVLMDTTLQTPEAASRDWFRSALGSVFFDHELNAGRLEFTLPDNTAVYEATGRLKVEVDATAALQGGQLRMTYRSAESGDFVDAGTQPAVGAWEIQLTPAMADLPHSQNTRWRFGLEPTGNGAALEGAVHVKVTAFKGWEPEQWPAHPDFWGNETTLTVADQWTSSFQAQQAFFFIGERQNMEDLMLPNGALVPHGTKTVEIDLTYTINSPGDQLYDGLFLYLHGADSNRPMFGEPTLREPGHAHYVFIVDDSMADSPYTDQSSWGFSLALQPKTAGLPGPAGFAGYMAQVASGSWTMDIIVHDHAMPEAVELRGGDDGNQPFSSPPAGGEQKR